MTPTPVTPLSRTKGQLVADVLNSQHAGTGASWQINTKILSTCRGRRHIVSPHTHLVLLHVTFPINLLILWYSLYRIIWLWALL